MPKLPVISGRECVRALGRIGYEVNHQRGSHIILRKDTPPHRHLSVPDHKELRPGLLRGIIRDAGLSVEQFVELL